MKLVVMIITMVAVEDPNVISANNIYMPQSIVVTNTICENMKNLSIISNAKAIKERTVFTNIECSDTPLVAKQDGN
jgi:hypothetical protein